MSSRKENLLKLWGQVKGCTKCEIASVVRNKVFGDGNIGAKIVLVGEAPGVGEDEEGHPFIGSAGRILNESLAAAGLKREEMFICNILKCHPPKTMMDPTSGNRAPRLEEVNNCLGFLRIQMRIIRPRVVVALGAISLNALMGKPPVESLTDLTMKENFKKYWVHPEPEPWWIPGQGWLVAAYHPQYLGYRRGDQELRSEYNHLFRRVKEIAYGV